ncbi:MAG: phage integrase N-terminal SAM-like domain-containing protein, partial [Alphaproteobacteria bacterium]|nr:phage integrase N-terminal SAM-like domain-containing protein [Alphaproteobacteria bacterium]
MKIAREIAHILLIFMELSDFHRYNCRERRFYDGNTHPRELTFRDVERFLSDLAVRCEVSASTQRQALNALVFLYRNV